MNDDQRIIEALGADELTAEEQGELLASVNDLIFEDSLARIIEKMDDVTRDEFAKLMEGDADEEAIEAFLSERVPDADQAVAEAVRELSDDILAATGTNKE